MILSMGFLSILAIANVLTSSSSFSSNVNANHPGVSSSTNAYHIPDERFRDRIWDTYYPPHWGQQSIESMWAGPEQYEILQHVVAAPVSQNFQGEALIEFYQQTIEHNKPWFNHMVNLRLRLLQEAKLILPQMKAVIKENEDQHIDFRRFARKEGVFGIYGNLLQAMNNQNEVANQIYHQARRIEIKFLHNHHTVGQEYDHGIRMKALKDGSIQYRKDLKEILDWTNPNTVSQVHKEIEDHPAKDYTQMLYQQRRIARILSERYV